MMKPRPEREVQAAILAFLRTVPGVVAWRNNVGGMSGEHKGKRWSVRFGFPGLSDIIGWKTVTWPESCARFLAIECKREGEEPTPAQEAFLYSVHKAGGIAIVARNVDDVARALGMKEMR